MLKHSYLIALALMLDLAACADTPHSEDNGPDFGATTAGDSGWGNTFDAGLASDGSVDSGLGNTLRDAGAASPKEAGTGLVMDAGGNLTTDAADGSALDSGAVETNEAAVDLQDTGAGDASDAGDTNDAGTTEAAFDCTKPPQPGEPVGWASMEGSTSGGGAATPVTVTSFDALKAAAQGNSPAVLWIKGSLKGDLSIGSNKTLIGLCGAELHGHIELSGSSNVILQNLKIVGYAVGNCALDPSYKSSEGCSSGADAITVQKNAKHIWIDHCDISDGTDGNLDITNGSNYVTVSWSKFHYTPRSDNSGSDSTGAAGHRFSNLIGGTDNPSYDDPHSLNVTWHHNWWADHVVERQPRVRFGKNHLFNNLWTSGDSNYCVRAGKQAQILVEAGIFKGVKNPQEFNNSSDQGNASITARDNVYDGTSGSKSTGGGGTAFTKPPYSYELDPTDGLADKIRAGVGPR